MQVSYAELHCISNFSFLRGASHPEEMVERALALGYSGLAITDECSFAGSARAHLVLRETIETYPAAGEFKLIHGTELRLGDESKPGAHLVLLATTRAGYGNLSQLVTLARRAAIKGSYRLTPHDIEANLPLLGDSLALLVPALSTRAESTVRHARWLAQLMPGRSWIACELTRGPDDAAHLAELQAIAGQTGLPLVASGDVHMHVRGRKPLQDALTAVRHKVPLAQCGARLFANAERYLRPLYRLARIYPPELLAETLAIAERCTFSLGELRYEYPEEAAPAGETPTTYLRRATYEEAAARRYPQGMPEAVRTLVEYELKLIEDLQYEPYFLTVYDIVRFARSRKILCQGRGSAANSAVCFCLGITEVDPARSAVLFERFISKERNEPPDIDVDFEHQRREEVMQYIYDRYGRHRAALTAALHTYRPRGAVRDIGKTLGLSLDQVDRLAKTMAWWDGRKIQSDRLIEAGFDPANPVIAQVVRLAQELVGFPRHLSQHSGGFVIARDRLDRLVPIENAAMADRTVIQWDKDDLDALGLLKIDVLALGMLSCIRRAFDHVNGFYANHPQAVVPAGGFAYRQGNRSLDLDAIPSEDERVYDMLCDGDSLGVFQVESRAQMNMLPRLRPRKFYDLVIEVAIVRPGPIQGGMVHPYLKRRQKIEEVTYPSKEVEVVLERTLGVSIFQEQVMQLAVVAAGFTPGEADKLRRAMAAWKRKGGIGPFRDKLIHGMLARGYTAEYAEQIYRQIQGFGEYGFPESHAASFALLVYSSSWLKCHEPAAFCAALLDSQPLGFYAPAQIVRDAQKHGVEVRPIDVTVSDWTCVLEPMSDGPGRPAVRLGLELVSGFSEAAAQRLVTARNQRAFADLADLGRRAALDRGELNALAAADAFASLTGHRRQALWAALGLAADAPGTAPLTAGAPVRESKVNLRAPSEGQNIVADYDRTSLTLRRHPLALLRGRFDSMRLVPAAAIGRMRHKQLIRTTGIVTCRQRPSTASGVTFVTLEDETGTINVVVWRTTAEEYRRELLGSTLLTVYGHVERTDTPGVPVIHVIAQRLVDHSPLLGRLNAPSRDFH
ncbi:MAG TPA: error-prone DNA polymerase [Burkholderiaceae bacterium]|nr:error-prone DNA polymerase [Burkholderiaceae bacterium]